MGTDYGWLWPLPHGRQIDGFFIDSGNRILFWPRRSAPGYILDEDAARAIMRAKEIGMGPFAEFAGVALFFGAGAALAVVLHPYLAALVSEILLGLMLSGLVFLAGLPMLAWHRARVLQGLLAGASLMAQARPKPQVPKPCEFPRWWVGAVGAAVAVALGIAFVSLSIAVDGLPGDRLFFLLAGLGLVATVGRLAVRQVTGVRLGDIHFYQPHGQLPQKPLGE